jgi:hypothetical protein
VTTWSQVFLGVIAGATLITAIIQVGVLIAAGRLARRISRLVDRIELELKPTFTHVNTIGRDAARVMALASAQVERADHLLGQLAQQVETTVATVQTSLGAPAREGKALMNAFRAAVDSIRETRRNPRSRRRRAEEEDALFI